MKAKKWFVVAGLMVAVAAFSTLVGAQIVEPSDPTEAAFFRACSTGDMRQLISLVNSNQPLVWVHREFDGKTGLHVAAMNGKNDAVKFLLYKGADPNAVDIHGHTPMYDARQTPYPGTMRILHKAGGRWSGH